MKYKVYSEERFNEGFILEADSLEEAEQKAMDFIDIHKVNSKEEIIKELNHRRKNKMETDIKYNLTETTREEAKKIINFLVGFWKIKIDEVDFRI